MLDFHGKPREIFPIPMDPFFGYVSTNASLPRPSEAVKNSPELMKGNEKK